MGKNNNNYFTSLIQRYGRQDFIQLMSPSDIQTGFKNRLFRDLVRGNIDLIQYGKYFLDPKFLDNIIIACQDEATNELCLVSALELYDNTYPGNQITVFNKTKHTTLHFAYSIILDRLNAVKVTGEISPMIDIAIILSNYKYKI